MRACLPASAVLALGVLVPAHGQEKARIFCVDPANKCPGADCRCAPDTLEVTFDGRSRSTLDADRLEPGARITVTIVTDTKSDDVQGWSYGMAHDAAVLELMSVTTDGIDATTAFSSPIVMVSSDRIRQCLDDDPRCPMSKDGGGWISATVLPFHLTGQLPIRRNSLAIAEYTLLERPGPEGTVIGFSERMHGVGSPPVRINFTVGGRSKVPMTLIDGFISPEAPPAAGPFFRGDANGDGRINVTDGIGILLALLSRDELACEDALDTDDSGNIDFVDGLILLRFLFDRGPAGPIGTCAPDSTADLLDCSLSSCG